MTGKKEELNPLTPGQFNIYACGPTVYNYVHIGNARPLIVFDTLRRYLEYRGYKVNFVQNFTDVDDKMIRVAAEEGITVKELGDRFIDEYFKDAQALNVRPATIHPKATEHIGEIIALVQKLIDKGHAYELNGDVYFDTQSFPGYGKLSGQDLSELELGARIDINESKKNPMDFALWKAQKDGEIAWDSPWGKGRPGWHIECSAMSMKYLGDTLDIHGGGQDLKFPHHENEVAQSEAATGKPFANYWMHNGYITIDNEKMSKSKGNFFTVRDILKDYDGEVIRFFLLSGHYRNPINFSDTLMEQAKAGLARMQHAKENLKHLIATGEGTMTDEEKKELEGYDKYRQEFIAAMDDDLNTADAISAIFELITAINTDVRNGASKEFAEKCLDILMELASVVGLLQKEEDDSVDEDIQALVDERQEARKAKNFARADEIRDLLKAKGITLKDTPQGVQIIKE